MPRSDTRHVDMGGALASTAATGLRSSAPGMRLGDDAAAAWLRAVDRGGLTGHAVRSLAVGDVVVSESAAQAASRLHRHRTIRTLQLEQTLVAVCELLDRAGIASRVLKGPALARTVYADAGMRTFVDVDVLVPSGSFDRAVSVLADAGHERLLPELRPGFDRRFAKSATLVDGRGCHVDLHRTLTIGPFGLTVDTDALFRSHQVVTVAGRPLHALDPEHQFLHICYHAALGDVPPRLSVLRDVAETALRTPLDEQRVLAIARSWRGEIVVARALRLAWVTLTPDGATPLVRWAFEHRPCLQQRWLLASYVSSRRSNSWRYLASATVIRGLRPRLAYLCALLSPQRGFLDRRTNDRWHWWLHGAAGLWRRQADPRVDLP